MESILAIETSTPQGTIARYEPGKPAGFWEFRNDRSHNSGLFPILAEALKAGPPDCIVVGTGPGSYSGIRVGIAAGLGISLAHGIPLIGVSSLCGIGEAFSQERYAITGDARRGSWWYAEVENGRLTLLPEVGEEKEIAGKTSHWPGQLYTVDPASPSFCGARPVIPRADVLACRLSSFSDRELEERARAETEPLYLRAPFISVSRKKSAPFGLPRGS